MRAYSTVFWKTCAWEPCGRWFPVGHARKMTQTCSDEHHRLQVGKLTRDRRLVKNCTICGCSFATNARRKQHCPTCIPDEAAKSRFAKYGVTEPRWRAMVARYRGKCWLCKIKPAVCVDHCHRTGVVRGALCIGCNAQLGHLEATNFVTLAQAYLKRADVEARGREPVNADQAAFALGDLQATDRARALERTKRFRRAGARVRAWAREEGWTLSDFGPIPVEVISAWHASHPGQIYKGGPVSPKPVSTKLTWAMVDEIRSSNQPQSALAERFGVSQGMISRVRLGQAWREDRRPA